MWRCLARGYIALGIWIGGLPMPGSGVVLANAAEVGGGLAMQLRREGLPLAPGIRIRLAAARLPPRGVVPATAIQELAGRHRWDRFAAESRLAPVRVEIEPIELQGRRVGHQVRTAFTLRTRLDDARAGTDDVEPLELGQTDPAGSFRELSAEELARAGVAAADGSERFAQVQLSLLNRIEVRGVIRLQRRLGGDSLEVAWAFDHRFDSLPDYRATAARFTSNELGERVRGSPEPYAGGGGIVVARQLPRDAAAGPPVVVVESRLVFSEPEAWFGGSNLLRAKIPLITQEGVRSLRRRLELAAAE